MPVLSVKTKKDVKDLQRKGFFIRYSGKEMEEIYPTLPLDKMFYSEMMFSPIVYYNAETNACVELHELIKPANTAMGYEDNPGASERALTHIDDAEKYMSANNYYEALLPLSGSLRLGVLNEIIKKTPMSDCLANNTIYFCKVANYGHSQLSPENLLKALNWLTAKNKPSYTNDNVIDVYRGQSDKSTKPQEAFSWTTDLNVANHFASSYGNDGCIVYGKTKRSNIAYSYEDREGGDEEHELLIAPGKVTIVRTEQLIGADGYTFSIGNVNDINRYILGQGSLYQQGRALIKDLYVNRDLGMKGEHDATHSLRVLFLVLSIGVSLKLKSGDLKNLMYAAAYHDIGRINQLVDDNHGRYSKDVVHKNGLITNDVIDFLVEFHCIDDDIALRDLSLNHTIKDKKTATKLYNIIKDADALDRVRFGLDALDINMLRVPISKRLTPLAVGMQSQLSL